VRILGPIVSPQALLMASRQSQFGLRRGIRTQLVSHPHIGREAVRCGRRIFIFSSVGVGRLRTTAEGDLVPDKGIEPPTFGLQNRTD
jgi:hypothetical protein